MDNLKQLEGLGWIKPDWPVLDVDNNTKDLLKQCSDLPKFEFSDNVLEIIRKSKEFPIQFPISTIRLQELKVKRPVERLTKNIASTYPVIHERVLLLMARFLTYKREFGTSIEKDLYKDMSVADLIDRILRKRAVTFMGPRDTYKLLSGEDGKDGWESVGTDKQQTPLVLENCLSYDEMKLSSMVYVSGYTECINDGKRQNKGIVKEEDIEDHAVIIGVIGPRFKRKNRMEYEDAIISEEQNTVLNGFGEKAKNKATAKSMWRKLWAEFYQVQSPSYGDLTAEVPLVDQPEGTRHEDRYVKIPRSRNIFDNEVYYKRISVTAECALLEAEARAAAEERSAFLNIIGAGLGVWRATPHQNDVYVLTFLDRIRSLLTEDLLNHVTDVYLSYIEPSSSISELFTNGTSSSGEQSKRILLKSKTHPSGGINVHLEKREPSSKLSGEHQNKLLVMMYAWDGNAHPGNEFWIGKLASSGDPAAACSTQVSELHNAHINSAVSAHNTRVVGRTGLATIQHYCSTLAS